MTAVHHRAAEADTSDLTSGADIAGTGQDTANADHADAHPSTAALAGHPLHPMLVPVPIGMLGAAALADVAWLRGRDPFFARASRWLLGGAIASGLAAAPFGLVDFATIPAARRRPEAWLHGGGNLGVMAMTAGSLALRARHPQRPSPA